MMNSLPFWHETLLNLAWKGAALLALALVVGLTLSRISASRRYVVWLAAVLSLAALPLTIPLLPEWRVLPAFESGLGMEIPEEEVLATAEVYTGLLPPLPKDGEQVVTGSGVVSATPVLADPAAEAKTVKRASSWEGWDGERLAWMLPGLWLVVAVGLLGRLGVSAWRLGRLEKVCGVLSREVDGEAGGMVEAVAAEIGLRAIPKVLVGPREAVPMVWGVVRSRLLLPEGFQKWEPNQLRAVLLHELAHLKRRDPLALWLTQVVHSLHWFNPLAWLTLRRLRADQERACDDTVLRQGIRPSEYAQHLLNLSRHTRMASGLSLCALAMARPAPVAMRITAILDPQRARQSATRSWCYGLMGLAFGVAVPLAMLQAAAIGGALLRGRILDRNGVVLAECTTEKERGYPLQALAGNVLGHVTTPFGKTMEGSFGMEKRAEAELSQGKDVRLTLDARMQRITHQAMVEAGATRGAAVVIDPRTGDLLAMVSLPNYDVNHFVPRLAIEQWDRYVNDKDLPLLDRTLRPVSPGATFTPVTALAGIAAGKVDENLICDGTVKYGEREFRCWISVKNDPLNPQGHGKQTMQEALLHSCNCYWYQLGNAVGEKAIANIGQQIGFGETYGILDKEVPGGLDGYGGERADDGRPKAPRNEGWIANLAIGQGMVFTSPLQLSVLAATLANGGKVPQPRLTRDNDHEAPVWRADLTADGSGINAEAMETLRKGLWRTVHDKEGTARRAKSEVVEIAGKTGAVQVWSRKNNQMTSEVQAWFIGFAPYKDPTLAFAILVEGGQSGGRDCAPIAKQMVEKCLALPADGSGVVEPLPEMTAGQSATPRKAAAANGNKDAETNAKAENGKVAMSAIDARRWKLIQEAGGLADLPQETTEVRSELIGKAMFRNPTLHFTLPTEVARAWMQKCQAAWRQKQEEGIRDGMPLGATLTNGMMSMSSAMRTAQLARLQGELREASLARQRGETPKPIRFDPLSPTTIQDQMTTQDAFASPPFAELPTWSPDPNRVAGSIPFGENGNCVLHVQAQANGTVRFQVSQNGRKPLIHLAE